MQNTPTIESVILQLNSLSEARHAWEVGTLKASNDELYGLLGRCSDLYDQVRPHVGLRKALYEAMKDVGIKSNSNAKLALRVVRWVFGECGSAEYTYAKVIELAARERSEGTSMAQWLLSVGGIEGVRKRSGNSKNLLPDEARKLALSHYESSAAIATISNGSSIASNPEADHLLAVCLVKVNALGGADVVYTTHNNALVNAVLTEAGKRLKVTSDSAAAEARSQGQSAAVAAVIHSIASTNVSEGR